jgi:hypothetical protein
VANSVSELRLNLLENGLDFIREGVEALYGDQGGPAPNAHKYALLHVFSGTLLVLKERLRRAHPSLIFKDVAKGGAPEAKTVDFDEVVNRLEGAAGVKLQQDEKTMLRAVQTKRNALEHFEAHLKLNEVNSLVGELVEFLERFLREQLQESIFTHVSSTAGRELAELQKIAEHLRKERNSEWRSRAKRYDRITRKKLRELAESGDDIRDGGDGLLDCSTCNANSVAILEPDIGICTVWECRELVMLATCDRCGRTATVSEWGHCPDCVAEMQDRMDRDD